MMRRKRRIWRRRSVQRRLRILAVLGVIGMAVAGLLALVYTSKPPVDPAQALRRATAALEAAGCKVAEFEAEDGKIEAKCTDTATNKLMEVYLDPVTGKVVEIKAED